MDQWYVVLRGLSSSSSLYQHKELTWRQDQLTARVHRVEIPTDPALTERSRYSIPYFVYPMADTVIDCFPTCIDDQHPAKYRPVTQAEYREMRSEGKSN